jgi:hypothetical protein
MACVLALSLVGCGSYYKIADPTTGKTYYSNKLKQRTGYVEFTDAATGSTVTIQNSEVLKISKDEFKANTPQK